MAMYKCGCVGFLSEFIDGQCAACCGEVSLPREEWLEMSLEARRSMQ